MKPQRLFLACWPDEEMRDWLAQQCRQLQLSCGGRRVNTPNLHLTVAFLGEVPFEQCLQLQDWLSSYRWMPRELTLDRFGVFPRTRVGWIGPTHQSRRLSNQVSSIHAALSGLGLNLNLRDKTFRPHLTLLRGVSVVPEVWPKCPPRVWSSGPLYLMRSVLTERGPSYLRLAQSAAPTMPG